MFSKLISKNGRYEEFDFFKASDKCIAVANFFIDDALEKALPITRKKVLKLTFMAQGFALATLEKSLFPDVIEAWPLGPVIPGLYFELKNTNPVIVKELLPTEYELEEEDQQLLEVVNMKFGHFSAEQLSMLTHKPGTPWALTKHQMGRIIDPNKIESYYKKLLA